MLSLLLANTRRPRRSTGVPVLRLSRERFARPACVCECLHLLLVRRSEGRSARASVEFQSRVILVGPFGASPVRSGSWDRRADGSAAVPSPGRRDLADNLPDGPDLRSTIRTGSSMLYGKNLSECTG